LFSLEVFRNSETAQEERREMLNRGKRVFGSTWAAEDARYEGSGLRVGYRRIEISFTILFSLIVSQSLLLVTLGYSSSKIDPYS
jgi:hypothetical protein